MIRTTLSLSLMFLLFGLALLANFPTKARAEEGSSFALTTLAMGSPAQVIAGGGGSSSGGSFALSGTIGQSGVGLSSGGVYTLNAGFWHGIGGLTSGFFSLYLPVVIR